MIPHGEQKGIPRDVALVVVEVGMSRKEAARECPKLSDGAPERHRCVTLRSSDPPAKPMRARC